MPGCLRAAQVEDVLGASAPRFIALQATLFMEEFWKTHTRPRILQARRRQARGREPTLITQALP